MAKETPCKGCFHHYGVFAVNKCCNYVFDIGTKRPCPAGEECTKYITEDAALAQGMRRKAKQII